MRIGELLETKVSDVKMPITDLTTKTYKISIL